MTYIVNLDFRKGPSFGLEVTAASKQDAIDQAVRTAPQYGFDGAVKKATAVPATTPNN